MQNRPYTLDDAANINYLVTRGKFPGLVNDEPPQHGDYRLRSVNVRVNKKYMHSADQIPDLMNNWMQHLNQLIQTTGHTEQNAALAAATVHVELSDEIHPYGDGNGESARWWATIVAHRINKSPFFLVNVWDAEEYQNAFHASTKEEKITHLTKLFIRLMNDSVLPFRNNIR